MEHGYPAGMEARRARSKPQAHTSRISGEAYSLLIIIVNRWGESAAHTGDSRATAASRRAGRCGRLVSDIVEFLDVLSMLGDVFQAAACHPRQVGGIDDSWVFAKPGGGELAVTGAQNEARVLA